ncbi:hypothetical protein ACVWXB_001671 [Streptomyces sp. TE12347]
MGAGDCQDVAGPAVFQRGPQVRVVAVDLVAGDPAGGRSRIQGPGDHPSRQYRLGREGEVFGDAGGPAAVEVVGPRARDVQGPVDRGMPAGGGVDEVDGDLGVLDPARRAGVLALDADRGGALLQVAGLVDHQHGFVIGQVLDHVGAYVVADRVGVPLRAVQQVLHAVRGGVARVLGQRPAVLPWQVRQQAQHQRLCVAAWFDPREPARDTARQLVEHRPPPGRHYAVTCGHRLIFVGRHNSR